VPCPISSLPVILRTSTAPTELSHLDHEDASITTSVHDCAGSFRRTRLLLAYVHAKHVISVTKTHGSCNSCRDPDFTSSLGLCASTCGVGWEHPTPHRKTHTTWEPPPLQLPNTTTALQHCYALVFPSTPLRILCRGLNHQRTFSPNAMHTMKA
jgi:hypothetical protein